MSQETPDHDTIRDMRSWFFQNVLLHCAVLALLVFVGHGYLFKTLQDTRETQMRHDTILTIYDDLNIILFALDGLSSQHMLERTFQLRLDIENALLRIEGSVKAAGVLGVELPEPERSAANTVSAPPTMIPTLAAQEFAALLNDQVIRGQGKLAPETTKQIESFAIEILRPALERMTTGSAAELRVANATQTFTHVGALAGLATAVIAVMVSFILAGRRRFTALEKSQESDVSPTSLRYDPATGLPNRNHLLAYLRELGTVSRETDMNSAILHIQVSLPRGAGTDLTSGEKSELYRDLGQRLSQMCHGGDFIAALGPGEFAIIASTFENNRALGGLAEAVHTKLSMPYETGNEAIGLQCTIGVALMADSSAPPQKVLSRASEALQASQASEYSQIQFWTPMLNKNGNASDEFRESFQAAIHESQFFPVFQPIIDTRTDTVLAVEALARWQHPKLGVLSPGAFIENAERFNLSQQVTRCILAKSLEWLNECAAQGLTIPKVTINVTKKQLSDPIFTDDIQWVMDSYGCTAERVVFEVTETALAAAGDPNFDKTVTRLRDLGFDIWVDDFGAGLIDVARLRMARVSGIKIDRAFIANLDCSSSQQAHVGMLIRHAKKLDMAIIAEGVETDAERVMLNRLGCATIQGFLFSRTQTAENLTSWMQARHQTSAVSKSA